MTGGWVQEYPDDVKAIKEAGHDLGNHSENHKQMSQLGNAEICDELNKVTDKVESLTGVKMCLFRPPYGDYDNHVITQADIMQFNGTWTVSIGKIMAWTVLSTQY